MLGKTFGKLTVLSLAPKDTNAANRCSRYFCQCECGNIVNVKAVDICPIICGIKVISPKWLPCAKGAVAGIATEGL